MKLKSSSLAFILLGILISIIAVAFVIRPALKSPPAAQAAFSITDDFYTYYLAPESWGYRSCAITDLLIDSNNLLMVVCSTESPTGVDRFAVAADTTHQHFVDRALVILNTAYALNVTVSISYDTSTSANPTGCSSTNCRALTSVKLSR